MENKNIENQLNNIQSKLDFITGQMAESQKRQREFQELKDDLTIIGKDIFNSMVEELDDVAPYFDTDDLIHLFKKLLRNTKNLNKILTQVEGAQDLYQDIQPLTKQFFEEILETLNEFDRKGYFDFGRELLQILDTVVTTIKTDDLKKIKQNTPMVLQIVKNLSDPQILTRMNQVLEFIKENEFTDQSNISFFSILKKMNNKDVKNGINFMLELVRHIAKPNKEAMVEV